MKPVLIILAITIIADFLIYFSLRRVLPRKLTNMISVAQSFLCLLFLASIILNLVYQHDELNSISDKILLYFMTVVPKVSYMLFWIVIIMPLILVKRFVKPAMCVGVLFGVLNLGIIIHGRYVGRTNLQVKNETLHFGTLPESFDGFRIVQITDFHLGSLSDVIQYVEQIRDRVNSLDADVILFTGDLVNSHHSEILPLRDILATFKARHGVYSVLGNHDYGNYHDWSRDTMSIEENFRILQQLQKDAGWELLNNQHCHIRRGDDSIAIIGVENWGEPPFGKHGDLEMATHGLDSSIFRVLLTHNPVHWREEVINGSGIELTLSGHTHSMQTQIGSFSPASFRYTDWHGIYSHNGQYLNVNSGLGHVLFPMRIGAYPEITLIELKK